MSAGFRQSILDGGNSSGGAAVYLDMSTASRSIGTNQIGRPRPSRRATARIAVSLATVGFALVGAGAAVAHVHSVPEKVTAGASTTVSFVIGHGCAGSPTTKVAVRVPAGLTKVKAVAPKGWKATIAGSVVTFGGGTLQDKRKASFGVSFTAPTKVGTLSFPTVQTCVAGETRWIDPPLANGDEPENPAPIVTVIAAT
jgi:periplasmic copper chaperone A